MAVLARTEEVRIQASSPKLRQYDAYVVRAVDKMVEIFSNVVSPARGTAVISGFLRSDA